MKTGKKATGVILAFFLLVTSAYGNSNALVYVIHGIAGQDLSLAPDLPVDVAVGDSCILEGFTYGQVAGPLELPTGTYDIDISLADNNNPCGNPPVIQADVPFDTGEIAIVIAHLAEDATPTASKFVINNSGGHYCGKFCSPTIFLHHTAAAPEVDIELQRDFGCLAGHRKLNSVANGNQAKFKVNPGDWTISLFPAGLSDKVLGPIKLKAKPCKSYFVFASGSLDTGSLTLLIYKSSLKKGSELELVQAIVYVVHGIPGEDLDLDPDLPVDISLNGVCALPEFTFGEITDALPLTPCVYNVKISLADSANPCNEPAVIETDVDLFAGSNVTIVAHLSEIGEPTASVFANQLGMGSCFMKSPSVVHHTAAAPTVDVMFKRGRRRLKLEGLSNGDQGIIATWPGRWQGSITPAGSNDPVFGPFDQWLKNRNAYFFYAVGSLDNETFTILQNEIPLKDLTYFGR
ncbi:MAG: DUF4397 domain-containing protein [Planctomycetota bacterium]|jgi:hypothetical protein